MGKRKGRAKGLHSLEASEQARLIDEATLELFTTWTMKKKEFLGGEILIPRIQEHYRNLYKQRWKDESETKGN